MPKEWLETMLTIMEDQYHLTAILRAFLIAATESSANCRDSWPHLNLIERFWGHLKRSAIHNYYFETVENLEKAMKRSAIHNYYFETVENLEKAIMKAVKALNRQKNHPLRLHLQTAQNLLKAA